MSDLAKINEQIKGMSADLQAMEKSFAQSERERWLHRCSTDRIPELVAEGELLADAHRMDYAVVRGFDGTFSLCAAAAGSQSEFIKRIIWMPE